MSEQTGDQAQPAYDENMVNHVVDYVNHLLNAPSVKDEDSVPDKLARVPLLDDIRRQVMSIRHMVQALTNGNLEYPCQERGFIAGLLKSFQSNLRHLTWQASRIAVGEYHHRVSFMGDFSVAFNKMTEQLDNTIHSLTSLSEKYKDLSYHDLLTGYYNRAGFFKHATDMLGTPSVIPRRSTLIITDIDHFKKFNDTYGHLCGDEVLKAFTAKIRSLLRSHELCCRYGGEEFIIFMPNTPIKAGMPIARRLRAAVESMSLEFGGHKLNITASFGVTEVGEVPEGVSVEDFLTQRIQDADELLYEAKSSGRNRVVGPKSFVEELAMMTADEDLLPDEPEASEPEVSGSGFVSPVEYAPFVPVSLAPDANPFPVSSGVEPPAEADVGAPGSEEDGKQDMLSLKKHDSGENFLEEYFVPAPEPAIEPGKAKLTPLEMFFGVSPAAAAPDLALKPAAERGVLPEPEDVKPEKNSSPPRPASPLPLDRFFGNIFAPVPKSAAILLAARTGGQETQGSYAPLKQLNTLYGALVRTPFSQPEPFVLDARKAIVKIPVEGVR
ncbi:MAG: diguanylate cyclase, partial [Desulfovibrionaceae bacterium]|nr:diguanylate cyclase [Desulfovibrionaceae bacterium]